MTSAREVHDCKAYLLVVAAGRDALTGSDRAIEIGQPGFNLKPFVTGRDRMPPPGGLFFGPELTMLHILTGTLDLSVHEARMFALVSIAQAPPDRYRRYVHLIRIFTPRRTRQELEQLMEDLFKDPFIDRFLEEGKQLGIERGMEQGMQQGMEQGMQQGMEQGMQQGMDQGMQQGMEQGKRLGRADSATRVLLTILAARGIAIPSRPALGSLSAPTRTYWRTGPPEPLPPPRPTRCSPRGPPGPGANLQPTRSRQVLKFGE